MPFAIVMGIEELHDDPQFVEREYFNSIDHPVTGQQVYPGAPFKSSVIEPRNDRAPLLGEHNGDIYCDTLGYTNQDLVKLRGMGVI